MNTPARSTTDRTIDTVVTLAAPAAKANVAQLCFEVWALRADRDVKRTLQILADDYPDVDPPDIRTLYRHAASDWPERADTLIRQLAPALAQRGLVRALALTPVAWARIAEALNGELRALVPPRQLPSVLRIEQEYTRLLFETLGVGTHGNKGAPTFAEDLDHENFDDLTTEELTALVADRLTNAPGLHRPWRPPGDR